jgi:uncharacterized protein (DUF305 family)
MKPSRLLLMAALHFLAMYLLMYAMIDRLPHFYLNFNQAYMAGIMTAPMLIIEIVLMRSMYQNQKALNLIFGGSLLFFALSFGLIRTQATTGDQELIRSMIPHHSGAILMCQRAQLEDPELIKLCDEIIKTQEEEIAIMEAMLKPED